MFSMPLGSAPSPSSTSGRATSRVGPGAGAQPFDAKVVELVHRRLESTHWKRRLPTVAVMSQTAIGEFYLRPVDY